MTDTNEPSNIPDENWEDNQAEIVQKIDFEDYQPKGTLAITILYFFLVGLMWLFIFFGEFVNNGPSIIN